MKENDNRLREILDEEEVPEELSPENMKKMLDEKAAAKKRSGISMAGRIAAGAAACAVVVGAYTGTAHLMKARRDSPSSVSTTDGKGKPESEKLNVEAPYMNGAQSYEEVYELLEKSAKKWEKSQRDTSITGGFLNFGKKQEVSAVADEALPEVEYEEANENGTSAVPDAEAPDTPEYSETYDQEEGVREADIVKTDGRSIYYVWNDYDHEDAYSSVLINSPIMNIADVKDGEFTGKRTLDLTPDISAFDIGDMAVSATVLDMYLYNGMIEVIGQVSTATKYYYDYGYAEYEGSSNAQGVNHTFVSVYTADGEPELIGTYFQEGSYNDVRIAPDGCMYLISGYTTGTFTDIGSDENIERYIPSCGTEEIDCLPPDDILMPVDDPEPKRVMSYSVISGIDLNKTGEFAVIDSKALAGFSGTIYSSAENIYAAVASGSDTDITRISIADGYVTPAASGTVEGYVRDQFSMSEYGGYFRVATTISKFHDNSTFFGDLLGISEPSYTERDNGVFVLSPDMDVVGVLKGFGEDETIKSVNFSGDMGYVVTYRQTDPLFAIDLSDPTAPFITDEFKINGYSTYMQKWDDGLLLGFGVNADDNGIETGVKLVMFDSSDPYDLKEAGFVSVDRESADVDYVGSVAVWERKALLIAPEKNLIGFPVQLYRYSESYDRYCYMFFSYENGKFVPLGEIGVQEAGTGTDVPNRAVYIGDYVYVLKGSSFISADIETLTVKDTAVFR